MIGRDEGSRLARDELAEPEYGNAEPSLIEIIYTRIMEWLAEVLNGASRALPGGWWTLAPLLVTAALLVIALIVYNRPTRRARRRGALVDTDAPLTARDHRDRAEEHARNGTYGEAIRERLRAISRELEDRAVVTPRPGRTATELAMAAGHALPEHRDALNAAAGVFNEVCYGERAATAAGYHLLRDVDEQVQRAEVNMGPTP
ncbi:DUF4129 domain-containing protein [Salinactinospora qingdaonensis]|uniref:DUF4129 domain-containing protein n=1 Tax=Salinactinospora qingdaonensis TaxID=702744 RepID=A0ABP7FXQ3_9ACTN